MLDASAIARLADLAAKKKLDLSPAPAGSARAQGFHLRDSVLGVFAPWSAQFEGYTPFMYTDKFGWVTTGIGNKIDPVGQALGLPWRKPGGALASPDEVTQAWTAVKNAFPGVQSLQSASLTTIRLDEAAIRQLVTQRLKANDALLARMYPSYPSWPADAQLATHSMGWAMGLGHLDPRSGDFKQFIAAVSKNPPDFHAAALASHMRDDNNQGIVLRNAANALLFENAARVVAGGGSHDVLYYLREVGLASIAMGSTKTRTIVTALSIAVGAAFLFSRSKR